MFGRRWRTREEIWYLTKYQLKGSWTAILFGFLTSIIIVSGLVVMQSWQKDIPNWFATIIGIYLGVLVSVAVYSKEQRSQHRMVEKIENVEAIVMSKYLFESKNIQNSRFYLRLALDGIIETYAEFEKLKKQWKKSKKENKKFLKEKISHIWQSSMFGYAQILDDQNITSEKLYTQFELERLRNISNECKRIPEFDEEKNEINDMKFARTIANCIVLLDKLQLDKKYRFLTKY